MKKAAFAADRAVAFDGLYLSLCFNLKPDSPAMASAAVFDQLNLEGLTGIHTRYERL
jgi:hypothetical protein